MWDIMFCYEDGKIIDDGNDNAKEKIVFLTKIIGNAKTYGKVKTYLIGCFIGFLRNSIEHTKSLN